MRDILITGLLFINVLLLSYQAVTWEDKTRAIVEDVLLNLEVKVYEES